MSSLLRLITLNIARLVFVAAMLLALYAGLTWALSPDPRPDAESIAREEAAREAAASESEAAAAAASEPDAAGASESEAAPATPGATPEPGPTTEAPEVLIAAAKPPNETTVQVLEAGGGGARVDAAVSVLEQIGYRVVAISPSSRDVTLTTVYFTEGAEAEARGLRARDPRFQTVEANRGLSEGVDIHVLVGPDF